jgi:ParB-like chromosome segregation protein Spo0J
MANKATPAQRRIEYRPLDDIEANPDNPKAHDVDTINDSVSRFGYIDGVVIDERTGYLISGHGRTKSLRAMRDRGEAPPDGVNTDDAGAWLVPVQVGWASRTDTEAKAALIALNRTTQLGGWVDESLLGLLDELSDGGNDMDGLTGVGYEKDDLDALRDSLTAPVDTFEYDPKDQDGSEVDVDQMQFAHECPSCGFQFDE